MIPETVQHGITLNDLCKKKFVIFFRLQRNSTNFTIKISFYFKTIDEPLKQQTTSDGIKSLMTKDPTQTNEIPSNSHTYRISLRPTWCPRLKGILSAFYLKKNISNCHQRTSRLVTLILKPRTWRPTELPYGPDLGDHIARIKWKFI